MAMLLLPFLAALSGAAQDSIAQQEAALKGNPADSAARRALQALVDSPATSVEEYERIREVLLRFPWHGKAVVAPAREPGERLTVSGTVRDAAGKPIAGALLHVFQTDAQGHYTRARVMDEPHARLFAFIVTGADGRFEFTTIRPGGYPGRPDRQGEEWRIPSHVHFEIEAVGFAHRGFQMVFDDDPRMTAYWREWAQKGRHPVVKVVAGRAVCDVVLGLAK
jgi:protocatechuate 3,4-dioxygenase beta subunit